MQSVSMFFRGFANFLEDWIVLGASRGISRKDESGGSGSDSGQFLPPSLISASLVGGPDSAQSSVARFSAAAFDPETFYQA